MSRQRLLLAAVVVVAVAVAALVAWRLAAEDGAYDAGGDERFAAYCEEVEDQQQGLGEVLAGGGETTGLIDALPAFRELAAVAPRDVADDWRIVVNRVAALEEAMVDADVDPSTYDPENPPEHVGEEQRERIEAAAAALVSPDSAAAFGSVSQHARDVCHTPLHL